MTLPPMATDISVIVPCFNEAKNLPELVGRLRNVFLRKSLVGQIVLVDDGSTDNTQDVAASLSGSDLTVISHRRNQGIEAAWLSGMSSATGKYFCFMDADLQYLPEDVWRLYREICATHADIVQGYRSSPKNISARSSRTLNLLLNGLFGMRLRDNKSSFVIGLRDTLRDVVTHRFKYRYFQTIINVAAHAKGYTIREVETLYDDRLLGTSLIATFPMKVAAGVLMDIAKGFVEFRLLNKREDILSDFLRANRPGKVDPQLPAWRRALFSLFVLTMPLHKWMITRRALLYYDELKQSQWLSAAQIRDLQERRLRRLVHHAYNHVGYYRELMDSAGLRPFDIRTLDDLAKLPFLEKDHVRENLYFDLLSDNHDKRKILKVTTSGSTGEPFVCFADQHQLEIRWAATLRSLEWTGYRWGDRQARLWHQTIGMSWHQALRERLDAILSRRLFIPAFELTNQNLVRFIEQLKRYKPALIDGYAESFNYIAHYVEQHSLEGIRPKGIVSSAQALPTESREAIEKAFGARVFDKYGSREFSGIAYECDAHDGHHVVAENFIVEILKEGRAARPGELGEVVITDLTNFCMPFIRYRIGDLAVAVDNGTPCACGRGLPRIGAIEGRVQSIIMGANGAAIPGTFFAHLFKDYDFAVRQFQIQQEQPGAMTLKVVKAARFDDSVFAEIITQLREYLGAEMVIDVEFVDRIPMVRTGKRQFAVSRVKIDFQKLRVG